MAVAYIINLLQLSKRPQKGAHVIGYLLKLRKGQSDQPHKNPIKSH